VFSLYKLKHSIFSYTLATALQYVATDCVHMSSILPIFEQYFYFGKVHKFSQLRILNVNSLSQKFSHFTCIMLGIFL